MSEGVGIAIFLVMNAIIGLYIYLIVEGKDD